MLIHLYNLRFFPLSFFSKFSLSWNRPSSLPTVLHLLLPFFHLRHGAFRDQFLYFFIPFCFCFSISFPIVSNHTHTTDTSPTSPRLHPFSDNEKTNHLYLVYSFFNSFLFCSIHFSFSISGDSPDDDTFSHVNEYSIFLNYPFIYA